MAVTVAVSAWALPRMLAPRLAANETAVVALLRMQANAQLAWRARAGQWADFKEIVFAPPARTEAERRAAAYRRPLMPEGFYPDREGIVLRAGYFFRQARDANGRPVGCWAWPKLRRYSGKATFWLDYARHAVFRVAAGDPKNGGPPGPAELGTPLGG